MIKSKGKSKLDEFYKIVNNYHFDYYSGNIVFFTLWFSDWKTIEIWLELLVKYWSEFNCEIILEMNNPEYEVFNIIPRFEIPRQRQNFLSNFLISYRKRDVKEMESLLKFCREKINDSNKALGK